MRCKADVRRYLNNRYQRNGWIGRDGPVAQPPRSPDLTSVDFWLWGHVKNLVYASDTSIRADCMMKIQNAFAEIKRTPDPIARATNDVARRFDLCQRLNGLHIEQYPHDMWRIFKKTSFFSKFNYVTIRSTAC